MARCYNNILQLQEHYLSPEVWKPSVTGDSQYIYGLVGTISHLQKRVSPDCGNGTPALLVCRCFGCIQNGDTPKRRQHQNSDKSKTATKRRVDLYPKLRHAKTATNPVSKTSTGQNGDKSKMQFWLSPFWICRRFDLYPKRVPWK